MGKYQAIGSAIGELVDSKNEAYGNAINDTEDFLKILWPKGVPISAYCHLGFMVRIFDKMKRIANNPSAMNEDPYQDIAGYGILGKEMVSIKPSCNKHGGFVLKVEHPEYPTVKAINSQMLGE